jgi:hypothetical protein
MRGFAVNSNATDRPHERGWYEIRLQGRLDPQWSSWFDGMSLTTAPDGITLLEGRVVDQAALHGVLNRLRDLGLPLISVARIEPEPATNHLNQHSSPGD